MKSTSWALFLLILILIGPHIFLETDLHKHFKERHRQSLEERGISEQIDAAVAMLGEMVDRPGEQDGYVEVYGSKNFFTERYLNDYIKEESEERLSSVHFWRLGNIGQATASALGLDRRHHFVNSYLVGFAPFATDKAWVPLYTLRMRKLYEYDHLQYSGLKDVWQNSRQAFLATRGDCEDHAVILADWLIDQGHDARVVLGHYKQGGHAWVVLIEDGREYLLEATSKQRGVRSYPLAVTVRHYLPRYQFNREKFWVNTASSLTVNYTGDHWQERSRFVRRASDKEL